MKKHKITLKRFRRLFGNVPLDEWLRGRAASKHKKPPQDRKKAGRK